MRSYILSTLLAIGILFTPTLANAELGDYSIRETLNNILSPPIADNPVNSSQRLPPYPLLTNPSNFDDGFSPGAYYKWQRVRLHPSTGAICGNGSPYKFFVNRVPGTSNTVYYFEGGGACWDYASCSGRAGVLGARNPNGIADNYLNFLDPTSSLVSPLVFRIHPSSKVKTQNWNIIYLPYCTGDIFIGDKAVVYKDETANAAPLVWHHNGLRNVRAVVAWLKDNLQKPAQTLMTGSSAGGVGSLWNYAGMRSDISPQKSYLINDSGPLFFAPTYASADDAPSVHLFNKIRDAWGLNDGPLDYINTLLPLFDTQDMGTIFPAIAKKYSNDRLGYTHFWQDLYFSAYLYGRFHSDIANEPNAEVREQKIHRLWHQETETLMANLMNLPNFGYYFPYFRNLNASHCTAIIEFANSDIQESGLELDDFINNILNGSGPVMQASELDTQADYNKPFNYFYYLINSMM